MNQAAPAAAAAKAIRGSAIQSAARRSCRKGWSRERFRPSILTARDDVQAPPARYDASGR
jgi:hypothetical protein